MTLEKHPGQARDKIPFEDLPSQLECVEMLEANTTIQMTV